MEFVKDSCSFDIKLLEGASVCCSTSFVSADKSYERFFCRRHSFVVIRVFSDIPICFVESFEFGFVCVMCTHFKSPLILRIICLQER